MSADHLLHARNAEPHAQGEVPVETLERGDLVLTADGDAKPVIWLGRQTIVSRFSDPVHNWPIRVSAGALADNVPSRDLLVSPDHALRVGDILVHAGGVGERRHDPARNPGSRAFRLLPCRAGRIMR